MGDVPLHHRTQLPPERAGEAKPPYVLADTSGQQRFGQTVFHFSGAIFDKLVAQQAANEEAEFHGYVNTALQEWETYIAENPGASFDDLQKQRDEMMQKIKAAGQDKKLTGIAKQNIDNWYRANVTMEDGRVVTNEGLIYEQAQTSMERIRSKQQAERSDILLEQAIARFDREGAIDIIQKQSGKRYPAEAVPLIIKEVEAEIENARQRDIVYALINNGQYAEAKAAIDGARNLSEKEKHALYTEVRVEESRKTNKAKDIAQVFAESEQLQFVTRMAKEPYNVTMADVNTMQIPANKELFMKVLEVQSTNPGAVLNSDPTLLNTVSTMIREDADSVRQSQIVQFLGRGLSAKDVVELVDYRNQMLRKDNPLSSSTAKRAHKYITDLQELGTFALEPEQQWQIHEDLDRAIQENPSPDKIKAATKELIQPYIEQKAKGWLSKAAWLLPPVAVGRAIGARQQYHAALQTKVSSIRRPESKADFQRIVTQIPNKKVAEAYYNMWKDEWQ